jgi:hypothetical protein
MPQNFLCPVAQLRSGSKSSRLDPSTARAVRPLSGAGGVNLARGPAGTLACLHRVTYPVGAGYPAGTLNDQEQLLSGRWVGTDGPARPHRQAGDRYATLAGGDSGRMQPDAAVRIDQTFVTVEAEDFHA